MNFRLRPARAGRHLSHGRCNRALAARGSGADDFLFGNGFTNILDGGFGNDVLTGRAGNDIYIVTNGDVAVAMGQGLDSARCIARLFPREQRRKVRSVNSLLSRRFIRADPTRGGENGTQRK